MNKISLVIVSLMLPLAGAYAKDQSAAGAASYATAAKVITLQGTVEAANRYDHIDFSRFDAGNALVVGAVDGNFEQAANATLKGMAYFDLNRGGLREMITKHGDQRVILSFYLMQVRGEPRPLRVEFIGTLDDVSSKRNLKRQFEAHPITRFNNVLRNNAEAGLKLVDITSIAEKSLKNRWLIIRFEQEGLRIENTGQGDFYQMTPQASSVRITLSDKDAAGRQVASHYSTSGDYNLITDMPHNLLGDLPKDLITDQSSDLTSDMPKNLLQDMPKDLITDTPDDLTSDMPENLIQDGGNQ
ncbi:hypothetical protein [Rubellicoccus peritrichatus]|uniref:Uncharacterized protein n=1 Tax=Rubellicoccus peritrichatus TaxID=3080537 RepID=A0AAQ3LBJ5_9BACT|nr:hypothetical protein [Puniceicoccus sp. CR14]WOO41317.1 hypothetical protein RZN69_22080 [Puniceicoccus sp. CR14]